jgi:hypothetical protein
LILEQSQPDGQWQVVVPDLGFPGGKNKDAIIPLPAESVAGGGRFRLRTNMEVYWDWLGWGYAVGSVEPVVTPLTMTTAKLRYRGYSKLQPLDRRRPDIPIYEVESTEPKWRDLEGYYTRFGDVLPLLEAVDDRYVIMNAGDEFVLEFEVVAPPPPGIRRDFVLVGDGWVKDGDFNTTYSRWVRPLPAHEMPEYSGPLLPLEDDPVFLKHRSDWQYYHTRYVTPRRFHRGLWSHENAPSDRH